MKPNFALNLSHDGISLLHRAQAGWLSIGDVSLDDPGLVGELGVLRRTAANLETGGLTTKLVIPNSQILYTEVDAPGPSTADRIGQIRDGLAGLTPYDVRDLVFDWRRKGKRAQVAVVARETLQEAEAFAVQYRFNPVSFVAAPTNGAFEGEPFFGPTRHAATILTGGETVQPDAEALHVLSPGETAPAPPQPSVPKRKAAKKSKPPAEVAAAEASATPEHVPEPTPDPAPEPAPPPATQQDSAPDTRAAAGNGADAPIPAFSHRRADPPAPAAKPSEASAKAEPPVTFSSRRANGQIDPVAPTPRARIAPLPAADSRAEPAIPTPDTAGAQAPSSSAADDPIPPMPPRRTPLAVTAPDTAQDEPKAGGKPRGKARVAGAALAGTLGKLKRSAPRKPAKVEAPAAIPPAVARAPQATNTPPRSGSAEAEAMTVFGARGRPQVRGKPRYLGLVLTLILLLALAILAIWSTYFMSDVTSGWFGTFEDEPEIAITEPAPQIAAPSPADLATTALPAAVPLEPAAGPASDTAATDAAPPPEAPAPDVAAAPPAQSAIETAVVTALTDAAEPPVPAPEAPPTADAVETARLIEPPEAEVPLPQAEPPAPVIRRPLTRPEAEARYAATGIWQLDPDPLAVPGSDRVDGLVLAAVDPRIGASDVARLPAESALDTDARPPALSPPTALGATFDLDERGVVRATTEGAVNPGGIQVFLGPPAYVPGARPADLPIPQDDSALDPAPPAVEVADPAAAEPAPEIQTEVASLGGFATEDLAAIRPAVRPASLWTEPEAERAEPAEDAEPPASQDPAEAAESDASSATELAVTASAPPAVRPQNFASLVEEALEEAAKTSPAPQKPETEQTVATARVPSIPTRASVAKQATERDAINLSKVNLIGVYGTPANRSALVRLKNGRFVKVEVGDSVDGGRVAAIGDGELRYIKRGRNITLKLPKG